MHTVYTYLFRIASVSFVWYLLRYLYDGVVFTFYLKEHFHDFEKRWFSGSRAYFNTKSFRDYMFEFDITTETTTLKWHLKKVRISFLSCVVSYILAVVFYILR